MTDPQVPDVWRPKTFQGTDLLPLQPINTELNPFVDEEIVSDLNIEASDLVVPRLKVLQGMSDEVMNDKLPPGLFYLSNLRQTIEPPIRGLIIFHSKSRALFPQASRFETHGLERCIAPNALEGNTYGSCDTCNYKEWPKGADGKTPAGQSPPCSLSNNFIFLTPHGPYVLRFARTSFKAGKNFLSDVAMAGLNFWHHPVVVSVLSDSKELGQGGGKKASFFKMDLAWDRSEIVPLPARKLAQEVWKKMKASWDAGRLDVGQSDEGLQREEA